MTIADTHLVIDDVEIELAPECVFKTPHIGRCMKSNQVGAEDSRQDLQPPGQCAQNFVGRKRYVEKETDARVRQVPSQNRRREHQVIVVNPDEVAVTILAGDRFGEALVDVAIAVPFAVLERDAIE
jgi:hypothetical protein